VAQGYINASYYASVITLVPGGALWLSDRVSDTGHRRGDSTKLVAYTESAILIEYGCVALANIAYSYGAHTVFDGARIARRTSLGQFNRRLCITCVLLVGQLAVRIAGGASSYAEFNPLISLVWLVR